MSCQLSIRARMRKAMISPPYMGSQGEIIPQPPFTTRELKDPVFLLDESSRLRYNLPAAEWFVVPPTMPTMGSSERKI